MDEGEGCVEIGDSGFAGDEGAGSEAFEEVGVDEEVVDFVDADAEESSGLALARLG